MTTEVVKHSNSKPIAIYDIVVGERYRKDLGALGPLKASITELGLLHPVVIDGDRRLLVGGRRLEACKQLGMLTIPAVTAASLSELRQRVMAEKDENVCREPFKPSEMVAMGRKITEFERALSEQRQREGGKKGGRPLKNDSKSFTKVPSKQDNSRRTASIAAKACGVSHTTFLKAEEVVEAATQEPEKYSHLVKQMDEKGKVDAAFSKLKHAKRREELADRKVVLPPGTFSVIYADPPWSYSNSGLEQSANAHYETAGIEGICSLKDDTGRKVSDIAHESSVLFMWATSPLIPEAIRVIEAWGFQYKACFVWVKNKAPGMGWWVQTRHELLMVGVKKKTPHPSEKADSVVTADVGRHSAKPDVFAELVERLYPGPKDGTHYVELFARRKREGWSLFGNES